MWRAKPLFLMLLRIMLAGMAIEAAWMFISLAGEPDFGRRASFGEMVLDASLHGGILGLMLAVPMMLTTVLCFRQIRRPLFYRFAMVTVALIVLIESSLRPSASFIQHALFSPESDPWTLKMIAIMLVCQAALVFACSLAAREYVREFQERRLALQKRTAD